MLGPMEGQGENDIGHERHGEPGDDDGHGHAYVGGNIVPAVDTGIIQAPVARVSAGPDDHEEGQEDQHENEGQQGRDGTEG